LSTIASPFNPVAEMYHTLWNDWYLSSASPALERMLFSRIRPESHVLDVCCGCGHVTKEVVRRGYQVTGVDASEGLIEIARREMPAVDWQLQDARYLEFPIQYDAALSTFDSLNHLPSVEDLALVFQSVHRALRPGAVFAFDMNLDEAYRTGTQQWVVDVQDKAVSLIRGNYEGDSKKVQTELIWFVKQSDSDLWRQHRSVIRQRSYSQNEILTALSQAGFHDIEAISGEEAGMTEGLGIGRLFVSALA
jgi:SAM-dependent methyltransferase